MSRASANLLLLFAAAIWGAAFVAQSTAMAVLSPLWFVTLRFILSGIVSLPLALIEARRSAIRVRAADLGLIAALTVAFTAGVIVQQQGILRTTVGNAGFLTSLYVLFTPFVAMLLMRTRVGRRDWAAAAIAVVGAAIMSGGLSGFGVGDAFVAASAVCWAVQIVIMEMAVKRIGRPFFIVFAQYLVTATASAAIAIAFDPIDLAAIQATWPEVAYAGIVSGGIGYTIQAVTQRHTRSSDAAVMFAMEAPFAMLFGILLLGERVGPGAAVGAALIFSAVLIVSLLPARRASA